ncbi:uncharacterized protein [Heptranchias perlo]|uniref:uncharacterized protein n=1 Tax=Heptranchias perlo TaxID=212740 RepID=UPI00355A9DDB
MASVLPVLLFCLFLHCLPTYRGELCMLSSTNGTNNSFSLMVMPEYFKPDMTYNVSISGPESVVTVALSASYKYKAVGEWANNSPNCSGVAGKRNLTLTEKWISPSNNNNTDIEIKFRAYIQTLGNQSFVMDKIIKQAPAPTNASSTSDNYTMSTSMPVTGNMTYTNMTTTGNMAYINMTTTGHMAYTNMTTTGHMAYTNMTTTGHMAYTNMTTSSPKMRSTVEAVMTTAGAITFKPLGGFASMLLLFITVRELLL